MARRKRKEDEAGDWVAPDFDEVSYMRTEIESARTAVATIAWAVLGAIVSFLLYAALPFLAFLAFLAGLGVGFAMYFVFPLLGLKTRAFKRKDWIGHGVTYFFSWLAFWILLLNPPFGDFTDPTIQAVSVSPFRTGYTGDLLCAVPASGSVSIPLSGNDTILVLFRATDNVGLSSLSVDVSPLPTVASLTPTSHAGQPSQCAGHRSETYLGGTYSVSFQPAASGYTVTITAVDTRQRSASVTFQVTVR